VCGVCMRSCRSCMRGVYCRWKKKGKKAQYKVRVDDCTMKLDPTTGLSRHHNA
jgi:hypothetical protein